MEYSVVLTFAGVFYLFIANGKEKRMYHVDLVIEYFIANRYAHRFGYLNFSYAAQTSILLFYEILHAADQSLIFQSY